MNVTENDEGKTPNNNNTETKSPENGRKSNENSLSRLYTAVEKKSQQPKLDSGMQFSSDGAAVCEGPNKLQLI